MTGLKKLIHRFAHTVGKTESSSKSASPETIKSPVTPKTVMHIGRRISFHIEVDSIQMAAVQHTMFGKTNLLSLKTAYLPKDATIDQRTQLLIKEVNTFIDEFAVSRSAISMVLSGQEVACRTIIMPELKRKDLDSAVSFEADRKLPFPLDQCVTGWRATHRVKTANDRKVHISLLAATSKAITYPLQLVDQEDQKISHVFHAHDVVGMLLPYLDDFDGKRPYALLWIGRHISEISFYQGSGLEFTQVVPVGMLQIEGGTEDDRFTRFAKTLGDEVQTALDYYAGQYSSNFTDSIYVYGELSYSKELIEQLPMNTGFEFTPFPVERIPLLRNKSEEILHTSLLCLPVLAACNCRSKLPNLLPPALKEVHKLRRIGRIGQFAIAVILISLMATWGFLNRSVNTRRGVLAGLTRQVEDFRSSEAYHQYNQLKTIVATSRSYMSQVENDPSYLSLNMKELSKLTPKQIRITRYNLNQTEATNLTIHGQVSSTEIPPEVLLAEYVETLNASPFYEQVNIRRHVKRKEDSNFIINFEIEMKGIL